MKSPHLRDESPRFSGKLRHYHRTNTQPTRTWDDWVDGGSSAAERARIRWGRGFAIAAAVFALLAVFAGLIIELR